MVRQVAGIKNGSQTTGRLILLAGLVVYVLVQGALMNLPLANWSLLPELDDSLTYALKTREMQECLFKKCPALVDLRQQLFVPMKDPAAAHQRDLVSSRIFPIYHPLFSLILLGLTKTGLSIMAAYQWLWRLSPLIFGVAFAYLLTQLTEPAAAGIALALLAFKIFPDTGLHHLVPSNLAMAGAVVVWARIISRQGWAPWTLCLSAILLPAIHPVGVLYTTVSIGLALVLARPDYRKKVLLIILFMVLTLGSFFIISSWIKGVPLVQFSLFPPGPNPLGTMVIGALRNIQTLFVAIIRSQGGLFGAAPLFLGAVVLGLMTLSPEKRRLNVTILALMGLLLFGLLFYVSSHPGDVILRLWIPLVVILFGLVGQAFCSLRRLSRDSWRNPKPKKQEQFNLTIGLPLIILAVLLGYALQMAAMGGEQIITYIDFLRNREPLVFNPRQPELLLSRAQAGDRVFYNSLIIMPYFFIHGTLHLGAVYYNPALIGSSNLEERLRSSETRFAVTYNPTVYHPSFEGVDESRWWITSPDFHYSPLNKPRRFSPLAQEGKIAARDYQWLELEVNQSDFPKVLKIRVMNPGEKATLTLTPLSPQGEVLQSQQLTATVPAHWSGWLSLDLGQTTAGRRFRLGFPGAPDYQISGLVFGEEHHNWPWEQQAILRAKPWAANAPEITVSFDPRKLLPAPLDQRKISVLDDTGSSVLLQLD
jgi:hypothetical protein